MLSIKNLHAYYGSVEALKGIDIEVSKEGITCLIGSNGAGKTTTLKAISGAVKRTGSILFNGEPIETLQSEKIACLGISHVPESRHIFPGLTVEQNLETGTISWHGFFGKNSYREDLEKVYSLFPILKERRDQLGWSLSGGEQQMLAIGRAIMSRPKLLMLDEPSMGLAPLILSDLFEKIVEINKKTKVPILLVEQNAKIALNISDQAYVIEQGVVTISGKGKALSKDPRVIEAYLGRFAT